MVGIEYQSLVGKPIAILQSMVHHINTQNPDSGWEMAANTVSDSRDFWSAVKEHKGTITDLEFTFVSPNIFKSVSETEKAVRRLQEENGAQSTTIRLHNEQGALNPDSELVRDHVSYVERGGGVAVLKKGNRTLFNSQEKAKSVPIEESAVEAAKEPAGLERLIRRLFGR